MKIKSHNTIHELRKLGYWVGVTHLRNDKYGQMPFKNKHEIKAYYASKPIRDKDIISPKGGATIVEIVPPSKDKYFSSQAICNMKDTFNRRVALNICLGRIFKHCKDVCLKES